MVRLASRRVAPSGVAADSARPKRLIAVDLDVVLPLTALQFHGS